MPKMHAGRRGIGTAQDCTHDTHSTVSLDTCAVRVVPWCAQTTQKAHLCQLCLLWLRQKCITQNLDRPTRSPSDGPPFLQHTQTVPPPRRQHRARHFDMPLPVFGKGRPRKPRPLVETTPRIGVGDLRGIARLPLRGVAREGTVRVLVNGKLEALDVVCEARNYGGGGQRYFLCPTCSRRVWHLYLRDERLVCRRCAGLTYRSQHTRRRGLNRVRDLRRKLGAPPSPLAPVPPRPSRWRRDYHARLLAQLVAAEGVIAAQLRDMVGAVRRRLKRDRNGNPGAGRGDC